MILREHKNDAEARMREVKQYISNLGMSLKHEDGHLVVTWCEHTVSLQPTTQHLLDRWVYDRGGIRTKVTDAIVKDFDRHRWA